jgi:uncharacterized damage-inducible protein DinB
MTIAASLLPEFDHEMSVTRSLLQIVPDARATWKPHARSMTLAELATHIASTPSWMGPTMDTDELDIEPVGGPKYVPPKPGTTKETLALFDKHLAAARAQLAGCSDARMAQIWTMKRGGILIFSMPRAAVVRSFILNHLVHHRGQLSVYLRMCDVALPSIYGPTADSVH